VIDTPANAKDSIANCLLISDLALIVARPSYLDLEGAAQTYSLARQLNRRALGVISQANAGRLGRESLIVERAQRAMRAAGLNCAQTVIHNRLAYQHALATGKSVEEQILQGRELNAAAQEIAALYDEICLQLK
jgi:chromosome partitioning protein